MGGFEDFYAASYPRTVALAYLALGRWAEAEDVAVEAYARLATEWDSLLEREDPSRRVRVVALDLARAPLGRLVRRTRLLLHPRATTCPADRAGSTAAHLAEALDGLPVVDRCVLALHYVADLDVDEVADELGLSRAGVRRRIAGGRRHLVGVLDGGAAGWGRADPHRA